MSFLGAMLAFVLGGIVSFGNYKITAKILKEKPNLVAAGTVVRQLFNVGYLAAVYFLVPYTPFSLIPALVGAVLGLTLTMFFFTARLVKSMDRTGGKDKIGNDSETERGEK